MIEKLSGQFGESSTAQSHHSFLNAVKGNQKQPHLDESAYFPHMVIIQEIKQILLD